MRGDKVGPRDEGVYIPPIEKEKHEKEPFKQSEGERQILFATFFSYLKKLFDAFSPPKELAGKVINIQGIIEHLHILKNLFQDLQKENLSQSAPFTDDLSKIWHILTDDLENLEVAERKNLPELSAFRHLMDDIKNYPNHSDHRLGYYLIKHAEENWLPFPFIELLDSLHKEESKTGTLAKWIKSINDLISKFHIHIPFK